METLVERWEDRALEVQLLSVPHIRLRLGQMRQDWFWNSLGEGNGGRVSLVNQDLHPAGLYYGISYWHALFSPQLTGLFSFLGRLNLWALILLIAGISVILIVVVMLLSMRLGCRLTKFKGVLLLVLYGFYIYLMLKIFV